MQAIRRLQRHNRGQEIRVPPDVCKELGASARDYLSFDWKPGAGSVRMSKVQIGETRDGEAKEE